MGHILMQIAKCYFIYLLWFQVQTKVSSITKKTRTAQPSPEQATGLSTAARDLISKEPQTQLFSRLIPACTTL
jgi:hypothetical protein